MAAKSDLEERRLALLRKVINRLRFAELVDALEAWQSNFDAAMEVLRKAREAKNDRVRSTMLSDDEACHFFTVHYIACICDFCMQPYLPPCVKDAARRKALEDALEDARLAKLLAAEEARRRAAELEAQRLRDEEARRLKALQDAADARARAADARARAAALLAAQTAAAAPIFPRRVNNCLDDINTDLILRPARGAPASRPSKTIRCFHDVYEADTEAGI
jgi:hypothetical protein